MKKLTVNFTEMISISTWMATPEYRGAVFHYGVLALNPFWPQWPNTEHMSLSPFTKYVN